MKKQRFTTALCLLLILCLGLLTACGQAAPAASAASAPEISVDYGVDQATIDAIRETYSGDWYGWFDYYKEDGTGVSGDVILSFDFDAGRENSPVAYVTATNVSDNTEMASFTVQFGEDDAWSIGGAVVCGENATRMVHEFIEGYDSLLTISGDTESGATYLCSVRPWGMEWEDVREQAPENMPKSYDDWYLPQLQ